MVVLQLMVVTITIIKYLMKAPQGLKRHMARLYLIIKFKLNN